MSAAKVLSLMFVFVLLFAAGFFIAKLYFIDEKNPAVSSGVKTSSPASSSPPVTKQARVEPLTDEQRKKVLEIIETSDFAREIPEDSPISLRFFYFDNGERVWQDVFIISEGKIITSGQPAIFLFFHSKYIEQFDELGLCETIKTANANRDLGFESNYGTTSLLLKYSGMMEYRECFGF